MGGRRVAKDWGDVQPENSTQTGTVNLTAQSHPAIDVYDNSMAVLALDDLVGLLQAAGRPPSDWLPWMARRLVGERRGGVVADRVSIRAWRP
jgi:hypothetical protein